MDDDDRELLSKADLCAEEIQYFFSWAMEQYSPKHRWPVKIIENCSAIDVRDKSSFGHPVIVIPADRRVNGFKLAELIGHEIECHWRSSVNAELIGALKSDSEVVYEGFAKVKDNDFNRYFLSAEDMPLPYYIITADKALKGNSFAQVAEYVFSILPKKEKNLHAKAWTYTYRSFRGISNAENLDEYAFTKDRAYFEGYRFARDLDRFGDANYLSFSTLNRADLRELINLTEPYDLEQTVLNDKHIQLKALEKILKYLKASEDRI